MKLSTVYLPTGDELDWEIYPPSDSKSTNCESSSPCSSDGLILWGTKYQIPKDE